MRATRLLLGVTVANVLVLAVNVLVAVRPLGADRAPAAPQPPGMLRGRGLEIVDARGQVRASIEILPPDPAVRMPDGTMGAPATALLRLRSSDGRPHVKLAATDDGAGMTLGGGVADSYIQLRAKGAQSTVRLNGPTTSRTIAP